MITCEVFRRHVDAVVDGEVCALDERGLHDHLVEAGRVRPLKAGLVRVVRVAQDRDVRPGVHDLLRLDARDVGDDEIRRIDAVARDQLVARQQPLQLSTEEEIDPDEQDRGHGATLAL